MRTESQLRQSLLLTTKAAHNTNTRQRCVVHFIWAQSRDAGRVPIWVRRASLVDSFVADNSAANSVTTVLPYHLWRMEILKTTEPWRESGLAYTFVRLNVQIHWFVKGKKKQIQTVVPVNLRWRATTKN